MSKSFMIYHRPAKGSIELASLNAFEVVQYDEKTGRRVGFHCTQLPVHKPRLLSTRVLVHLKPELLRSQCADLFARFPVKVAQQFTFADNLFEVEVNEPTFEKVLEVCDALQRENDCTNAELQFLESLGSRL